MTVMELEQSLELWTRRLRKRTSLLDSAQRGDHVRFVVNSLVNNIVAAAPKLPNEKRGVAASVAFANGRWCAIVVCVGRGQALLSEPDERADRGGDSGGGAAVCCCAAVPLLR